MANKYDADLYLKYNNYGFSDKSISDVKTYLATQTLFVSLNTSQQGLGDEKRETGIYTIKSHCCSRWRAKYHFKRYI
jgi:hypothetical protein